MLTWTTRAVNVFLHNLEIHDYFLSSNACYLIELGTEDLNCNYVSQFNLFKMIIYKLINLENDLHAITKPPKPEALAYPNL